MKWRWNRGVERKANPLLRECTFLINIFLHQQWKQCLEFALAKLREICKYLAGACNSNSHARELHYLTFVCKTKQGKLMQRGKLSLENVSKELSVIYSFWNAKKSLCKLYSLHLPPKNHNFFVKLGTKRELEKKELRPQANSAQYYTRGGGGWGGNVRREWGGGAAPLHNYTWARWNVSGMTICETHKLSNSYQKEISTYSDLNQRDSRNQMMCCWSSQITSDCADCLLNPSRLVSPPPPLQLLPFLIPLSLSPSCLLPGTWSYRGVSKQLPLTQIIGINFAINPFCFPFPSLLLSRTFLATFLANSYPWLYGGKGIYCA